MLDRTAAHYLRHSDGLWPNLSALVYAVAGYAAGLALTMAEPVWANVPGVILLAHSMVIAAYLVHECAHNNIFRRGEHNARLGKALNWLTGSCYGGYEELRHKHMRHHVDRADVVSFDYREFLRHRPWLRRIVQALEWAYIPAVELLMHGFVMVRPFVYSGLRNQRSRILMVLAVRALFFIGLGFLAPKALLFYALAYCLFLAVMRFLDMHQHTFEMVVSLDSRQKPEKRFDREYEYRNTFSNPLSVNHPWLDLLVLNFGYHNVHHDKPTAPWYRLPAMHRELYSADEPQLLSSISLLKSFHRHRVTRVMNDDVGDIQIGQGPERATNFVGVYGVSFLTAV
jgi:fatty acid desaturase